MGKGGRIHSYRTIDKRVKSLTKESNVATFNLAPGYKNYAVYCQEAKITNDEDTNPLIDTDEYNDEEGKYPLEKPTQHQDIWGTSLHSTVKRDFDINGPELGIPQQQKKSKTKVMSNDSAELLKLHYKMGHIPFPKLKQMAQQGKIPKQLAKCDTPLCSACLYARQTRKPWRQKPAKEKKPKQQTLNPGDVVSVDQMISPTPGLVAQMTGILTTKHYKYRYHLRRPGNQAWLCLSTKDCNCRRNYKR